MSKLLLKLKQFLLNLFFPAVFARLLEILARSIDFFARSIELIRFFTRLRQFIANHQHVVDNAIMVISNFSVVYFLFNVYDIKIALIAVATMICVRRVRIYICLGIVLIVICAFVAVDFCYIYFSSYCRAYVITDVIAKINLTKASKCRAKAGKYRMQAAKHRMQAANRRMQAANRRMQDTGYLLQYCAKATKDPAVKCHTRLMGYCIQYIMYRISENEYSIRWDQFMDQHWWSHIQEHGQLLKTENHGLLNMENAHVLMEGHWLNLGGRLLNQLLNLPGNVHLLNLQRNVMEKHRENYKRWKEDITAQHVILLKMQNHYLTLLDHFPSIVALCREIKRIEGWNRLQVKKGETEGKSICPYPSIITVFGEVLDYLVSSYPRAVISEISDVMNLKIMEITKS
jgi:hypothetical protein